MTINIGEGTYYQTSEVVEEVGVSRSTLLRWIKEGVVKDSTVRDRRGWRLFTEADIALIKSEVNGIS